MTDNNLLNDERDFKNLQYRSYYELLQRVSSERKQMDEQFNNLQKANEEFIRKNPIFFHSFGVVTEPELMQSLKEYIDGMRMEERITKKQIKEKFEKDKQKKHA